MNINNRSLYSSKASTKSLNLHTSDVLAILRSWEQMTRFKNTCSISLVRNTYLGHWSPWSPWTGGWSGVPSSAEYRCTSPPPHHHPPSDDLQWYTIIDAVGSIIIFLQFFCNQYLSTVSCSIMFILRALSVDY